MISVAEIATDLTALGGSGWVGTGLLGAVLSWLLLVRLPANDKQQKDLLEKWTAQQDALILRHDRVVAELVVSHVAAIRAEGERCDRQRTETRQDYTRSLETICAALTKAIETLERKRDAA